MVGKLGKRSPVVDTRTLRLENYIQSDLLPAPPTTRAWDAGVMSWGVMLNDTLGCCVCAAMGHAEQVVTVNADGSAGEVTVPDNAVLTAYEQVGGYVPGEPNTDQGCNMLTALKWWQNTGIDGHRIAAYATCPLNQAMIETCIDLFGFCYVGFAVPNSAMRQFDNGQEWTNAGDASIDGGHCVCLVDYDQTTATCITWGKLQKGTWDFWLTYMSQQYGEGEAYAVITTEWLEKSGQSPSGLNWTQLQADVQAITGNPTPTPTQAPTTTSLVFSPNPVTTAQTLTLNATVFGSTNPTGTVTFTGSGASWGTVTLTNATGTSTTTVGTAGTYTVSASYSGDGNNQASTSPAEQLTVEAAAEDPIARFWDAWGPYSAAVAASRDVNQLATEVQLGGEWVTYIRSQQKLSEMRAQLQDAQAHVTDIQTQIDQESTNLPNAPAEPGAA